MNTAGCYHQDPDQAPTAADAADQPTLLPLHGDALTASNADYDLMVDGVSASLRPAAPGRWTVHPLRADVHGDTLTPAAASAAASTLARVGLDTAVDAHGVLWARVATPAHAHAA